MVIGGGIHGAAAAWDAAQRGLSVALVEAGDFGGGTSANSLKTIHGGLRHLARGDLAGLRESAGDRRALLRIAPALVRPLPFLVPTYGHGRTGREALALALRANDLLTSDRNRGLPPAQHIPPGRMLGREEVLSRLPGIEARGLTGGALWTDAQVASSERLVLAFLHAATEAGAVAASRTEVTGLLRQADRVSGVRLRDHEGGAALDVRARVVLSAAGPAADRILGLAGTPPEPPRLPCLAAVNLVLARALASGCALGAQDAGRFLFLVPWRGRSIVGTGYGVADALPGLARDFLQAAQRAFPWAGLAAGDVTWVHRGLVPGRPPAALLGRTRIVDHAREGLPGLLSIFSVKYTTARAAAERAVDAAAARLGKRVARCRTAETPLPASPPPASLRDAALRAARHEMALHLEDAVLRRLDLGGAGRPDPVEVDVVATVLADELGWDRARLAAERERLEATLSAASAR